MPKEIYPAGFDPDEKDWCIFYPPDSEIKKNSLTFATFNTWFGDYWIDQRVDALMDLLKDADADIIGLQEITPLVLQQILDKKWVRDHYSISDKTGITVVPYGVILLSRIPVQRIQLHKLPTQMERHALIAEFNINGQTLHVGVVHLESLSPSAPVRKVQLEQIFQLLEHIPHAVLMGDFNFCSSSDENSNIDTSYQDMWAVLRQDDPGYTEDTEINLMRYSLKKKEKKARYDRILLRSTTQCWKPKTIELIGTEPISPELPLVFPSDHFGLVGTVEW